MTRRSRNWRRPRWFDAPPGSQAASGRRLGLDSGARGRILAAHPGRPSLVDGFAQTNVGEPEIGEHHLGFIGAGERQETVDLGQDFRGLILGAGIEIGGHDTSGEEETVGLHGLGVNGIGVVADDLHGCAALLECWEPAGPRPPEGGGLIAAPVARDQPVPR